MRSIARTAIAIAISVGACGGRPEPGGVGTSTSVDTSTSADTSTSTSTSTSALWAPAPAHAPPERPAEVRWIAFGGVEGPWANELSIEDELMLATRRLGPGGVLLFAGGPGSHGVQVADPSPRGDALLRTLGELLDARGARDAHYQPLRLVPHGPGTRAGLTDALAGALVQTGPRLQIWIAGHGGPGETARDVIVATWDNDALSVADLEAALAGTRPFRIVQTTCFGGGFAEAVLTHAARACGLFATTWDLEASGCDPDPLRARESYGAHLLRALDTPGADLTGDGVIGLSEAHARATVAAPGFEVPILSSQAWLERALDAERATPGPPGSEYDWLLEERAILGALLDRLALGASELEARFDALRAEESELTEVLNEAAEKADRAHGAARMAVLARWPMLDDPWHPDFSHVVTTERAAIEGFLGTSSLVADWREAVSAADEARAVLDALKVRFAPVDRAFIARRTLERATFARNAPDGEAAHEIWATFQLLRQCEREAL